MALAILLFVIGALLHQSSCHPGYAEIRKNIGNNNGNYIPIERAPYVAGIYFNGSFVCASTIISEEYLISAASCFDKSEDDSYQEYKIVVGTNSVYKNKGQLYDIETVKIHPGFNKETYDYDICKIRLFDSLNFSSTVNKVEIADISLDFKTGTKLTINGWFYETLTPCEKNSSERPLPQFIQKELLVLSDQTCHNICNAERISLTHMICTEYYSHDPSTIDLGSPLTYEDRLVGITSYDYGCNKHVGLYTKVSPVFPWMMEQTI